MSKFAYVTIKMKEKMTNEEIRKFIEDNLIEILIEKVENNEVVLKWRLNEQEGVHAIEETMYYILDDNEIGDYSHYIPEEKS